MPAKRTTPQPPTYFLTSAAIFERHHWFVTNHTNTTHRTVMAAGAADPGEAPTQEAAEVLAYVRMLVDARTARMTASRSYADTEWWVLQALTSVPEAHALQYLPSVFAGLRVETLGIENIALVSTPHPLARPAPEVMRLLRAVPMSPSQVTIPPRQEGQSAHDRARHDRRLWGRRVNLERMALSGRLDVARLGLWATADEVWSVARAVTREIWFLPNHPPALRQQAVEHVLTWTVLSLPLDADTDKARLAVDLWRLGASNAVPWPWMRHVGDLVGAREDLRAAWAHRVAGQRSRRRQDQGRGAPESATATIMGILTPGDVWLQIQASPRLGAVEVHVEFPTPFPADQPLWVEVVPEAGQRWIVVKSHDRHVRVARVADTRVSWCIQVNSRAETP